MSYTTVGKALTWLENPLGKTVKHNRCEMVDTLNRIRQHFYLWYESIPLFLDGEECIEVQEFALDCNCKETYLGITLPREYETVEAIWINNTPIKMYDRWREYRDGFKDSCGCKLAMYDVANFFPTEREFAPCGVCTHVKFLAKDPGDGGKIVRIKYKDSTGQDFQDEIVLKHDTYIKTEKPVLQIEPRGGIVLPPDLVGTVLIADENGRVLSEYSPNEIVPSYRRMKLENVCCGDQVLVHASRKFTELFLDSDVIETDNRLAIEEAGRFMRYNDSTSADLTFEAKASAHIANSRLYLLGEKSRHRGKATISNLNYSHGPINKSGLSSKRGSMFMHRGGGSINRR